jgi:Trk K+ transport system NAD-binding subunit
MNKNKFNIIAFQMTLSLFTPTVIIAKIVESELIEMLENMGKASEEIFRGERLPILKDHPSNIS